jgi:hypothetical protein
MCFGRYCFGDHLVIGLEADADVVPNVAKEAVAHQAFQPSVVIPNYDGGAQRHGVIQIQTSAEGCNIVKKGD